jgi:hypothetical protein
VYPPTTLGPFELRSTQAQLGGSLDFGGEFTFFLAISSLGALVHVLPQPLLSMQSSGLGETA